MNGERDIGAWLEGLEGTGCGTELSDEISKALSGGMTDTAERLLRGYKRTLLDRLHDCEDKVDLVDFLLWQLKK